MKLDKLFIHCINQTKSLKKYTMTILTVLILNFTDKIDL